jgi:SAM-dependent methyltransferase
MTWSGLQYFCLFILVVFCLNYLILLAYDRIGKKSAYVSEGFETDSTKESTVSLYTWISDPQLYYDDFYAGVYDQLCNQHHRAKAKIQILKSLWEKSSPIEEWSILDVGCGTGHSTVELAKLGAGRIVGMDYSTAMLKQAETVVQPQAKLDSRQSSSIVWRRDTLLNPSACSASEFTHCICFYFTFYYMQNQEEFFRFMNLWIKPGGKLCVEVVNKYKFDPILESASPFVGFSLQKYSEERITKSKVTFDKFDYEAEFTLTDPKAEFYETFRFKNGHVRRQKHVFYMPTIEQIIEYAKLAGWKYIGYQDLNPVGFEYCYLLTFEKT